MCLTRPDHPNDAPAGPRGNKKQRAKCDDAPGVRVAQKSLPVEQVHMAASICGATIHQKTVPHIPVPQIIIFDCKIRGRRDRSQNGGHRDDAEARHVRPTTWGRRQQSHAHHRHPPRVVSSRGQPAWCRPAPHSRLGGSSSKSRHHRLATTSLGPPRVFPNFLEIRPDAKTFLSRHSTTGEKPSSAEGWLLHAAVTLGFACCGVIISFHLHLA